MTIDIIMIVIGFALLVVGADFLVKGCSNIATKFHIPEMLIGLTIVAIGTSAPELIITITSARTGATDLIIGNAIGSNLCNLLFILGLMAVITPIKIDKEAVKIHLPISLSATLAIWAMEIGILGSQPEIISRIDGIILITLFLIYFTYPIIVELKDIIATYKAKEKEQKSKNALISVLLIALGVILLKYGGDFVVNSATKIAQAINLSERVIGLTVVAIGTALPELVTSIVAVAKKDTDLAVGNLVGSCVFNLLLIIGFGAIITPLNFSKDFSENLILLVFTTLLIWLFNFVGKKNTLTRSKGVILLTIFAVYMFKLFI